MIGVNEMLSNPLIFRSSIVPFISEAGCSKLLRQVVYVLHMHKTASETLRNKLFSRSKKRL